MYTVPASRIAVNTPSMIFMYRLLSGSIPLAKQWIEFDRSMPSTLSGLHQKDSLHRNGRSGSHLERTILWDNAANRPHDFRWADRPAVVVVAGLRSPSARYIPF